MAGHTRTRTGCWTCKEAGYKCDEQKPHCGRCIRLKKECKGYGMKLKWKNTVTTSSRRSHDTGRGKSIGSISVASLASASSPMSIASIMSAPAVLYHPVRQQARDVALHPGSAPEMAPDVPQRDKRLLHYWFQHLASLISITPRNGQDSPFQTHLAAMTYQQGPLRSTLLAMAANHLSLVSDDKSLRIRAYRHQQDAIHLLQQLIQTPRNANLELALATVLMMQVSSRLFGEEEPQAANHLIGAKAMIARKGELATWRSSSSARFLLSLFAYHDILSSVSRGSRPLIDHTNDFTAVEGAKSMESIAQVLHVVARISVLHELAKSERLLAGRSSLSGQSFALGTKIQQDLLAMDFSVDSIDPDEFNDIKNTAQAYRHAAFIYLYRVWLDVGAPNPSTLNHVQHCITCIGRVSIRSPLTSAHIWPLFTAGCEAIDTIQRQSVRERFQAMYDNRKFPSLKRVLRDIEDVWVAKDMEHLTGGLDRMSKVDCIQVILQRRGREVDLA